MIYDIQVDKLLSNTRIRWLMSVSTCLNEGFEGCGDGKATWGQQLEKENEASISSGRLKRRDIKKKNLTLLLLDV